MNNMGKVIAECRLKNDWSQEDLAGKLNVSNKTVSKWECGGGYPDQAMIPKIAALFNITIDCLFGRNQINIKTALNENNKQDDLSGFQSFTSHMQYAQSCLWELLQCLDRIRQGLNHKNEICFQKTNEKIQKEYPNCFVVDWDTVSEIWWKAQDIKQEIAFLEIFSCTIMISVKDAACFLGFSEKKLRKMAKEGEICSKEIDGELLVLKSDIENLSYQYWKDESDEVRDKNIRASYQFYINKP